MLGERDLEESGGSSEEEDMDAQLKRRRMRGQAMKVRVAITIVRCRNISNRFAPCMRLVYVLC